ncbi:spondin domain-containing protein [Moorena sp. SIO3H5]|uniref:spondin domain-containing protein n=1 Tax=Moorena sp. SIO3H5 TaxID=2607834 RepID=UPI0013BC9463|nr:spondin domain-containing protein [Moorena sp. SIO3H5]NEO70017.1 PEP-CTERM sorting domain-containing protein [Moorena sp. SIO3H5]
MSTPSLNRIGAAIIAIGSVITINSPAAAITLKVTMTNLAPTQGQGIAPVWFGFHDGSFDLFDEGASASFAIEVMAEDGIVGNAQGRIPPDFVADFIAEGADPIALTNANQNSIASNFATSPASLGGGYQDLLFFDRRVDPYFGVQLSGETTSRVVTLDGDSSGLRYFSYAGMIFPTNDGFIANDDSKAIEVFDGDGNFLGADFIVLGSEVWDAGTEVNDEDPVNVPYDLANLFSSTPEGGVVQRHPGLLPAGSGGIVDFEFNGAQFVNADFSAPDYQIARITIEQVTVPAPSSTLGLLALGILGAGSSVLRKLLCI